MKCNSFRKFRSYLCEDAEAPSFNRKPSPLSIQIHHSSVCTQRPGWKRMVEAGSMFLEADYLQLMAREGGVNLEYRFVEFFKNDQLVGIAAFQITHFEGSNISLNIRAGNPLVSSFLQIVKHFQIPVKFDVLVCGNAFVTGEHGFVFTEEISANEKTQALALAIDKIKEDEKMAGRKISACVVKDFYPHSFALNPGFRDEGFGDFSVDPTMMMSIDSQWLSFDDYLHDLVSKYRTKANSVMKRSSNLEIRPWQIEDWERHSEVFTDLYEQVYQQAEFKLGKLDIAVFRALHESMGNRFLLNAYFFEGKLVGFQSAFDCGEWLEAHFIGLDYSLNKEHAIYQRMLYEYVDMGIRLKKKQINFGRTATEIKSTIGAYPVQLSAFIRHRRKAPNLLLKLLFNYVRPSDYRLRLPFKKMTASAVATR